MKLCACITERTLRDCVRAARETSADIIEHRIDFMDSPEGLGELYSSVKTPFIATNRPTGRGGKFSGTEDERVSVLLDAIEAGCSMVDIEIGTGEDLRKKVIDRARSRGCKVIISMHDFSRTPSREELLGVMRREKEGGADIGKIVTTAGSAEDCQSVLSIIPEAVKEGFPLVAFAMGEMGRITRLAALFYGSPFMYASAGRPAGPGQLSVDAMRDILGKLSV